jgi:hypothetical protein
MYACGLLFLSQAVFAQSRNTPDSDHVVSASAETQQTQEASTTPRVLRVAGWTVGGTLRLRFEDWDFFKAQSGESRYGYGCWWRIPNYIEIQGF